MRRIRVLAAAVMVSLLVAAPAAAAKPQMERIAINDIGITDDFLTDYCGFDVWFDATGHIIIRSWTDDEGNPLREVNNFDVHITYYSDAGSLRVVDVGADRVTWHADGSLTLRPIGNVQSIQIPGEGRIYSNVGWLELLVTFHDPDPPTVELVGAAGQHSETSFEDVLCELLAP